MAKPAPKLDEVVTEYIVCECLKVLKRLITVLRKKV